jgi:hypothetical protein
MRVPTPPRNLETPFTGGIPRLRYGSGEAAEDPPDGGAIVVRTAAVTEKAGRRG